MPAVDTTDFTTAAWRKLPVNALAGFMVLSGRRSAMFRRDDDRIVALHRRMPGGGALVPDSMTTSSTKWSASVGPAGMGTSMLADRAAHQPLEMGFAQWGDRPQGPAPHGAWPPRSATCWCRCWRSPATVPG